ncbi:hypothetical protein CEE45_04885 [Candidatus Heimdallarchaeota archaeon B3_Heim]|nr:MAG: hypothetical protein CEE45_04885 [Candidatus Heimdallarchaeota archaeon B3_Heim]
MILASFIDTLTPEFKFLFFILIVIALLIINWIIQFFLSFQLRKISRVPLDIVNLIKIFSKLITALSILFSIMAIYGLSVEGIIGVSAFLGAIVSFGSTQMLSNLFVGVYIIFIRPFGVDDFIAVGNEVRGQVVEISLNYTKIRTINNIFHYIPNKNFMNSNITLYKQKVERRIGNTEAQAIQAKKSKIRSIRSFAMQLIEEEVVRYTFIWGAPLGDLKTTKEKIQEVCDIYTGVFGYKPEFFLYSLDYRMQFKIIITTHSTELLLKNIMIFRNEIVARFH